MTHDQVLERSCSQVSTSGHARPLPRQLPQLLPGLLLVGLLAIFVCAAPTASPGADIGIGVSVRIGPPPLPVYEQPPCPGPGYLWTPGYWAYDPVDGYFWVPGTWVVPPTLGLLWTPGYWGWGGSAFFWHAGYWGPHVGFYGGVNYGFGYPGVGFVGGEWRGRDFYYNRAVSNVHETHITNVYYRQVNNYYTVNRVSYNGGPGGLSMRPGRDEIAAQHDRHYQPTSMQDHNATAAHNDRAQFANVNHGVPQIAAARKPAEFTGNSAVRATRAGGPINGNGNAVRNSGAPGGNPALHLSHDVRPGGHGNAAPSQTFHPAPPAHTVNPHGASPAPRPEAHPQYQQHGTPPAEGGKNQVHPQEHRAPEPHPANRQAPERHPPEPQH